MTYILSPLDGDKFLYDLYARLLEERIIFVTGTIDDEMADRVIAQLLYLETLSLKTDILMLVNSQGGAVTAGMAILDTMRALKCQISTLCIGQAASMGVIIMLGGAKGKRLSLPNSRFLIHQPLGGAQGTSIDIEIQTEEILRIKELLNRLMAEETGQKLEDVVKDTDRDNFMSAQEAKKYGIIDKIVKTIPKIANAKK
ncbi:ATP-dependent Clp protease proteolytic subunit [bacterium]|nr:ATP-dependent Clp protease proteolytic subunit [bacterium]